MSGRNGRFIGGPLDGVSADVAGRAVWYFAEGHAYMRTDAWRWVGVVCDGCSSVNQPDENGRTDGACQLCGAELAGGTRT